MTVFRWLGAAAVLVAVLGSRSAYADQSFEASLQTLANASDDAMNGAVEAVGATGDPRALTVLQALDSGDLLVGDGHVFVRDSAKCNRS